MKILQIQLDTAMGGIESFLYNVYSRIDRNKFDFDFIEYGLENRNFEYKFTDLGAKIYKIPNRKKNPISSRIALKKILQNNNYSVVHIHKNSLCDLSAIKICRKAGIPTIVIHSHNSNRDNKFVVLFHKINRKLFPLNKYYRFACSNKAGKWLYGNKYKFEVVNNGIELEKFIYNEEIRNLIRKKLDVKDNFVIGNVGRLSEQKNPLFLVDIFHYAREKNSNIKLLWVGDGELREKVENRVKELEEENNVIFTGRVSNPEIYYQAMDLFIMPSFYEGFPIAAIEAQTCDLPIILSSNITSEAKIKSNVVFLNLNEKEKWVNQIYSFSLKKINRNNNLELMKKKGYDINSTVEFLEKFYLEHK